MRLSLRNRIFLITGIFAVLALLTLWQILRPKYETSIIADRVKTIQQVESYVIEDIDHTIAGWSNAARFIASEVTERPKEGEVILRSMVALHPEIIQIKIQSPKLSDELTSQNTIYSRPNLQINDSVWIRSKMDSVLQAAWFYDTASHQNIFVTQKRFQVQNIPFILTLVCDAGRLNNLFAKLPLGEGYFSSIQGASSVLMQNISPFKPIEVPSEQDSAAAVRSVRQYNTHWNVITRAFQSVQLWITIAVPDTMILKPLEDVLFFATFSIIGLVLVMSFVGWILSFQIKRPVIRLVKDVRRLSYFDFTQTIQIPAMKDLRPLGDAIELLRQSLERNEPLQNELNDADRSQEDKKSVQPNSRFIRANPLSIKFVNPPEPKTIQWHPSIILTAPGVNRPETSNVSYEWRKGQALIGNGNVIEAPLNAGRNVFLLRAIDQDHDREQPAEVEIVINCE
jgi:HAMP domain-containing protein